MGRGTLFLAMFWILHFLSAFAFFEWCVCMCPCRVVVLQTISTWSEMVDCRIWTNLCSVELSITWSRGSVVVKEVCS